MAVATAALRVPLQCQTCSANGWIQLHRRQQGPEILLLEWSCTNCQHRWAVTTGDVVSPAPNSAPQVIARI